MLAPETVETAIRQAFLRWDVRVASTELTARVISLAVGARSQDP
jgi:hypothetical protein